MAEADETKRQEESEAPKKDAKAPSSGMLQWIIMGVVVIICAGAGLGLGRLFAGGNASETAESSQREQKAQAEEPQTENSITNSESGWFYELDPLVACLDEPGMTRYVRAALTLKVSSELSKKQGQALLAEKKPVLINWLSIYLAGLKIDDTRGDRNKRRIQSQILDAFNERLFPDAKPQIQQILFKEFVVQ